MWQKGGGGEVFYMLLLSWAYNNKLTGTNNQALELLLQGQKLQKQECQAAAQLRWSRLEHRRTKMHRNISRVKSRHKIQERDLVSLQKCMCRVFLLTNGAAREYGHLLVKSKQLVLMFLLVSTSRIALFHLTTTFHSHFSSHYTFNGLFNFYQRKGGRISTAKNQATGGGSNKMVFSWRHWK